MLRRRAPLIVGSLLILMMIGFVALYRSSPGDLSRAHDAVAGSPLITDCNKCHASQGLTWGCLHCHKEIQAQLTRHSGYHAYLATNKKTECAPCHSDHLGKNFDMVNKVSWQGKDPKGFKHDYVDYRLKGKHDPLSCDKCHASKWVKPFVLAQFPKFPRPRTYLGLSQDCVSCHEDVHARGLASACATCHGQDAWKPTQPLFNHDKVFPLTSGHANLKCVKCHILPSQRPLRYDAKKFPFERVKGKSCVECHKNPHFTQWVEKCDACHQVNDKTWAESDRRMTRTQHAMTGFRLIAPHRKTKCLECHGPDRPGIPFNVKYPNPHRPEYKRFEKNCEACHKDAHRAQFIKSHTHCLDCHILAAFMPPKYSVTDHKTYPLLGGHIKAACNTCHIKSAPKSVRQYVPTPKECVTCHKDIHFGQFRNAGGSTLCENCHRSTVAWSKLIFNHSTQSRFKLDKAHEKVACKACHPWVSVKGVRLVQYKPLRMLCRDCHAFDH